jgi:hypothetical protein
MPCILYDIASHRAMLAPLARHNDFPGRDGVARRRGARVLDKSARLHRITPIGRLEIRNEMHTSR